MASRQFLMAATRPDRRNSDLPVPGQRPATRAIRVLLVEHSADDAWRVQRQLERGGFRTQIVRVQDATGLRAALAAGAWDLVVVDCQLPDLTGLEAVRIVRTHDADVPCLLMSGAEFDLSAIEAMREGATDYLPKDHLIRLVPAVERELRATRSRLERRRAEASLAASEERLRVILEQAPDAVVIFAADGRVTEWNARATTLFGRPRAGALRQPFGELILAPRWQSAFAAALEEGFHSPGAVFALRRRIEVNGRHADGSLLAIELTLLPVPSSAGLSYCAFVRDLSEWKAAEAKRASLEHQLRQSQKMEAVGKLAGGIAHDFNNLLTVVQGQASLLEAGLLPIADQPAAVSAIVDATDRAGELTRQLLAFSRQQVVRLAPLDLNELVRDLGRLLRRLLGADIALQTHLSPGSVGIEADASMIEQVLMNFAVNARDAMPRGGVLVVSTAVMQAAPPPRAVVAGCGPGPYVRLSVKDAGSGISPEHLPHIFEPFFTTKDRARATGLGLATVFGIVEQHRGWVDVDTAVGQGTTFHVFLPHRRMARGPALQVGPTLALPRGSECILVVEDEEAVREMVRDVLQRQGFRVLEAGTGQEALSVWDREGDQIDLVVTDIIMPEGLTGTELVSLLRRRRPTLKAVFTSGYSSESDRVSVDLHEGVNFLQKPFRPTALVQLIRSRLDEV